MLCYFTNEFFCLLVEQVSASGYLQSARVSERLAVSVGVAKSAAETLVATPTANGPQVGGSRGK